MAIDKRIETEYITEFHPRIDASGNINFVINGDMEIIQRYGPLGSKVLPTNSAVAYVLDHWRCSFAGTGAAACTVSQVAVGFSSGIGPYEPRYFHRWAQTAGTTATVAQIQNYIEDLWKLQNRVVTLSFWAKADAGRTLNCWLTQYFGSGGSPNANVSTATQNNSLTTSWQKFTYTVSLPSISGLVIGTNDDHTTFIHFQPNTLNATQTFDITNVQLEIGPIETPFKPKGFNQELRDCERYFEKAFGFIVVPADNLGGFQGGQVTGVLGTAIAGVFYLATVYYKARKRAGSPTVTIYNPANTGNGFVHNFTRANAATANSVTANGQQGFTVQVTGFPVGWVASDTYAFVWTSESEI